MKPKQALLSIHIEKTAGTSLLQFFESAVGKNRTAFYDPETDAFYRISDLFASPANGFVDKLQLKTHPVWPVVKKMYFSNKSKYLNGTQTGTDLAVIHGHYTADRFDEIMPDTVKTIVLRNPLERMVSQFEHWKRAKGRSQWRIMVPYSETIQFEEFALLPQLQNYQMQYISNGGINGFAVVGVTDEMDLYTKRLFTLLKELGHIESQAPYPQMNKLNTNGKLHTPLLNGFEGQFKKFHRGDYELYEKAKEISHG